MTISDLINSSLKEVATVKEMANSKLKDCPKGHLRVVERKGTLRYYHRLSNTDTSGVYLKKDKENLIRELENKEYYVQLEKTAAKQQKDLQKINDILLEMPNYKSVFLSIPKNKRKHIQPYEYVDEQQNAKIQAWQKNAKKKYFESESSLITLNGEHVKSKSELIIADRLNAAGVPYHYEKEIGVFYGDEYGYTKWMPDFMVLNVRTGQEFIWEHFGMMDKEEYSQSCQIKLEIYAENGYFPGKNLIISSETSKRPLSTRYIDKLIKEYLK